MEEEGEVTAEDSIMAMACEAVQTMDEFKATLTASKQVEVKVSDDEPKLQGRLDIPEELQPGFITERQLAAEQRKDPYAKQLIEAIKNGSKAPETKWYAVRDDLLCRVTEANDPTEGRDSLRPYVPTPLRVTIIRNFHDSIYGCHKGARDTYLQISSRYFWHKMDRDIKEYVSTCVQCQMAKARKPSSQGHIVGNNYNSVLSTITMDLMGPLQTAGSGKRGEPLYLLVMVDPFSHRVWLEPIYSKHAEQIYDAFVRRILLEWGPPRAILTDNVGGSSTMN